MISGWKLAAVLSVMAGVTVSAADWPQWRGPSGTGIDDENEPAGGVERHRERGVEGARSAASASRRRSYRATASS